MCLLAQSAVLTMFYSSNGLVTIWIEAFLLSAHGTWHACFPPGHLCRCIALRRLPADEPQLSWLLQLMELAVSARSCLRECSFVMPAVPAIKV